MKYYKTIEIPHLRFVINFLDMTKLKEINGKKPEGMGFSILNGYDTKKEKFEILVFIHDIKNSVKSIETTPLVAHEIMHAIQFICEQLQMEIQTEKEHMAYLMFYILEQLIK